GQRGSRALVLAIEGPCPGLSPAPSLGAALALASPRVIASNRDAYDHDGTGNLVLGLISGDGLVTDGTWSSRAKTPESCPESYRGQETCRGALLPLFQARDA